MPSGSRLGGAGTSGGGGCCGFGDGVVGCGSDGCGGVMGWLMRNQSTPRPPVPPRVGSACALAAEPLYDPLPANTGAEQGA
jgi:hypothetical protein